MSFKEVFNFKKRGSELISVFKNIKTFDFLGRLKTITSHLPSLIALAGATLMLIGSFLPYIFVGIEAGFLGISQYEYANLFQCGGWFIFFLAFVMTGLAYFKQTFWAGLTSALCFTVTALQGIIVPASYKAGYWYTEVKAGVHVGWFFLLLGELAILGAFVLQYFVQNKNAETPAIETTTEEAVEAVEAEADAE